MSETIEIDGRNFVRRNLDHEPLTPAEQRLQALVHIQDWKVSTEPYEPADIWYLKGAQAERDEYLADLEEMKKRGVRGAALGQALGKLGRYQQRVDGAFDEASIAEANKPSHEDPRTNKLGDPIDPTKGIFYSEVLPEGDGFPEESSIWPDGFRVIEDLEGEQVVE